jgi:hypothetical protein
MSAPCRGGRSSGCWADKVPFVAGDVEKHSDKTVGFGTRRGEEPDGSGLVFSVSSRQERASLGARRPHCYPPLRASVVRQGRGVRHELETQYVHEEADSWVVLADHYGNKAQMHGASIGDQFAPAPMTHPPARCQNGEV